MDDIDYIPGFEDEVLEPLGSSWGQYEDNYQDFDDFAFEVINPVDSLQDMENYVMKNK